MIKIFGIRHHGPGSAKSLVKAFQDYQPTCILIEGPPDADKLIEYAADPKLKPPVSIMIYNPKDLTQVAYYPFAEFSPEWQAMKYAAKQGIEVRFMDLPQQLQFSVKEQPAQFLFPDDPEELNRLKKEEPKLKFRGDPIAYIAKIAGYSDSERWWNVTFEQRETQAEIFPVIQELMTELRSNLDLTESRMTLLREAYMRKTIRQAAKEGFERIAVVCGAWHSPALDIETTKAAHDNKILRGMKKVAVKATWVPWNYDRISIQSGYGAGIVSPAWYEILFQSKKHATIRWMTKAARLLRAEDLDASSAHVIEGVRLAEALAALRNLSVPGIEELEEAATSIFAQGYSTLIEIIRQQLIIGNKIGKVPGTISVIPLQQDIERQIKSARLSKFWHASESATKEFDMRKPNQLRTSHLLHRLQLIGIDFGQKREVKGNKKGAFHEIWKLKWKVGFTLAIIEAGMWGGTLYSAATNFIRKKASETKTLPELTLLMEEVLNADLQETVPEIIHQLKNLVAITKDVERLMAALTPLVNIARYGSTRNVNTSSVEALIDHIIPRICIGLPATCIAMDEEATQQIFEKIIQVNNAIDLLDKQEYSMMWNDSLRKISLTENIQSILRGAAIRILFDKSVLGTSETEKIMGFELSGSQDTKETANWLEGFLHGSGLLLIYNPQLWSILDNWVGHLPMADFDDLLPLLRRTFSNFGRVEREKMMQLAKSDTPSILSKKENLYDEERANLVMPNLKLLLGMGEN